MILTKPIIKNIINGVIAPHGMTVLIHAQQHQLVPNQQIFGMISGDYDQNQIINNKDYNKWRRQIQTLDVYHSADGDGNGIINNLDFNLWTINRSKIGHLKGIEE